MKKDKNLEEYDPISDPERERRPWAAVAGLVLAILAWIVTFIPMKLDESALKLEGWILIGVCVASGLLCYFGLRRAPGLALIGIICAVMLLIMLLVGVLASF